MMSKFGAQFLKYFGKMSEKMIHSRHTDKDNPVYFGSWAINGEFGLLRDGEGVEIRLEPRLSRLMSVLMSHGGHFVSRRQLIDVLWPSQVGRLWAWGAGSFCARTARDQLLDESSVIL